MPNNWLSVPHFRQELEYSCVAACARMVLAHYGDSRTEAELRSLLDTRPAGTPARNVMHLSGPAFEVYVRPSNRGELRRALADNQPPIVFLQTGALEYWGLDIFHTAIVVGIDDETVALNDSYFPTAPRTTSLQTFERAWASTGQLAAFVRPRAQPQRGAGG
ncbi:MAG TPA: C39 family peptidase [Gemmataceae bacterium]|nr:C39 family peptidase [Gemmataceae bacterium]